MVPACRGQSANQMVAICFLKLWTKANDDYKLQSTLNKHKVCSEKLQNIFKHTQLNFMVYWNEIHYNSYIGFFWVCQSASHAQCLRFWVSK